ncbi:MAG: rubrerythrin [Akkermansiaceae bacterium]|nr:rubrerythrin [Akkermansiaceae bacterium]
MVRAIRFMIAAEYESVQLDTRFAESTDNKRALDVLLGITDEEREHAGEFLRLLQIRAPDEQDFYNEGMGKTNEKIEKLKVPCKSVPCTFCKATH